MVVGWFWNKWNDFFQGWMLDDTTSLHCIEVISSLLGLIADGDSRAATFEINTSGRDDKQVSYDRML